MSITKAQNTDATAVAELVGALSHFYLQDKYAELPNWFASSITAEAFIARFINSSFNNYLYVIDGEVAGYLSIKDQHHIYHLFVAQDFQGQGIARALWEHALAQTQQTEFTVRSSLYAVPVYKRFGFRISESASSKDGLAYQPMTFVR